MSVDPDAGDRRRAQPPLEVRRLPTATLGSGDAPFLEVKAELTYIVFGVLTAFLGLVTAILRHIQSPTLAALALIAVGLVMLVTIAAITRYRPWRLPDA